MKKYIVSGGAGFIGSHLVDKLTCRGNKVLVWDDLSTGKEEYLNDECEFADVDIRQLHADKIEDYEDADTIFHLAALPRIQPSFEKPIKTFDINAKGTINVLELARKYKIKVVYAGSSSFYGGIYKNPYTFTKWMGEELCRTYCRIYGIPVAITRFFNVYGPRQPEEGEYSTVVGIFERQTRNGEALTVTGTGEQRRDFTHVEDIVSGLIALSDSDPNSELIKWEGIFRGTPVDFGTGKNYSINEVARMFGNIIKYLPSRPGEAQTTLANNNLARRCLGWEPTWTLEQYVEKVLKGR